MFKYKVLANKCETQLNALDSRMEMTEERVNIDDRSVETIHSEEEKKKILTKKVNRERDINKNGSKKSGKNYQNQLYWNCRN